MNRAADGTALSRGHGPTPPGASAPPPVAPEVPAPRGAPVPPGGPVPPDVSAPPPGPAPGGGTASAPADVALSAARLLTAVRPPTEITDEFVHKGLWRTGTPVHDLYRAAGAHPHRTAVVAHRAHRPAGTQLVRLTFGQLLRYTERFAHGLAALGVGPGTPVAFQLPNWWEMHALFLACLRTGAVAVPVMPGYGARDLEAVLTAAEPELCVVPDVWQGASPAETLADLAPSLPSLRHRAVLGDAAATGALDFTAYFVRTPHERHRRRQWLPLPQDAANRACLLVNAVGVRDTHSMAVHTPNSLHAWLADSPATGSPGVCSPAAVCWSALPVAAPQSLVHTVVGPVTAGGTCVLQDVWDPQTALALLADAHVTHALAAPAQWAELVGAQQEQPRDLTALHAEVYADGDGTPTRLVQQVHETLHIPLTGSRPSAAARRAARPRASSPLAVWRRGTDAPRLTWDAPDVPVDAGGCGTDEVGGVFLLPVAEIEDKLRSHPQVADAVVVAYTDPLHGELACAVLVPEGAGAPPALPDVHTHLLAQGVARAHLPARLELLGSLPRAAGGGVDHRRLRDRLTRHLLPPTGT